MGTKINLSGNTKNEFGASPLVPNWVRGIQDGSKNQPKTDQKMRSTWKSILASIWDRFWWVFGAKLDPCWLQKPIQKVINFVIIFWAIPKRDYGGWRGSSAPPPGHHKWCPLDSRSGVQYPKGTVNRDWVLVPGFWHALGRWPGEFRSIPLIEITASTNIKNVFLIFFW